MEELMSTFLGIGFGPIQTGIFMLGAYKGGFDRIVVADVDKSLVKALREDNGSVTISVAAGDRIYTENIQRIEIYNPQDNADLEKLVDAAADADEIATALPAVTFFKHIAPWLKQGFEKNPGRRRLIYAAENNNHAAELLEQAVGAKFPDTHYLNTVVGKMSGVLSAAECEKRKLPALTPFSDRGHLVEEFNRILISSCPGIEGRKTKGLYAKNDLLPFEEAKLYGHNAIHMLLGLHAMENKINFMHELADKHEIIKIGRHAFIEESGRALCRKWNGVDELFTENGFREYAEDLLVRMVNPFLTDSVERVCRDLERKLGWDDRIIGTMRLAVSQGFKPVELSHGAAIAAKKLFGSDTCAFRKGFENLWPTPWTAEHEQMLNLLGGNPSAQDYLSK
jgi:mannitol-1-phosphate 5-dehydrogenase